MFKISLITTLLLGLLSGSLPCQAGISDAEAVNRAGMQRMLITSTALTSLNLCGNHLGDLKHADEIIYLDQGKIVERGTFDALVNISETPRSLLPKQMDPHGSMANQALQQSKQQPKQLSHGVAHIHSTYNNTVITVTTTGGDTVLWGSCGTAGFKGARREVTVTAGQQAEDLRGGMRAGGS